MHRFILSVALVSVSLMSAQECVSTAAGGNVGDTGTAKLLYQGKTVCYKTVRAADGREWLQQNLGSDRVAQDISDEQSYGDYFQYGRWDDGHQLKTSPTSSVYPEPNNPLGLGSGTNIFYIGGGSPWSWNYSGWFSNPDQNDTWEAASLSEVTAHNGMDPCKAIGNDWQMPSEADWDNVFQKEKIFPKPSGATTTGIFRAFSSNLKIPGAGARKEDTFSYVGQRGYLWTKTASKNPDFYRYVYLGTAASSTTGFGGDAKSFGYPVRCVKSTGGTLGTLNLESGENLSISPNPARDYFRINGEGLFNVDIISASGAIVLSKTNVNVVDVSSLSKGIYVVRAQNKGKNFTAKLIKQ